MKIRIQSVHFNADQKLLDFIQRKVDKLDQFFDRIIDGEVILRLEKSSDDKNKVAEIKVWIPGGVLFAKEQCKSFEEAADLAVESLQKQITKHKGKISGHSYDKEDLYMDEMAD